MSDDLRTRLTNLIYGTVSWRDVNVPVAEEVADAVIRELGLWQEECDVRPGWEGTTFTRYVTEWETA